MALATQQDVLYQNYATASFLDSLKDGILRASGCICINGWLKGKSLTKKHRHTECDFYLWDNDIINLRINNILS